VLTDGYNVFMWLLKWQSSWSSRICLWC